VVRPKDIEGVLRVLGDSDRNPQVIAGGTDLLLQYRRRPGPGITVVDIMGVAGLGDIVEEDEGLRLGSAVRLADLIRSVTVAQKIPVLIEGAAAVAGEQIRNLATVGGNICNASPSADTVIPLLVVGSKTRLISSTGSRTVPLCEFFVGPGETVLEPGELLESVWIPWPVAGMRARYTKLSPRRAMDLAVVGVAVALWRQGSAYRARIGLGAVGPTPIRARAAEDLIGGAEVMDRELASNAARAAAHAASPIDDVRGSAEYRRAMVERLVTRLLQELGEHPAEGRVTL